MTPRRSKQMRGPARQRRRPYRWRPEAAAGSFARAAPEEETQVVGRHRDALDELELLLPSELCDLAQVAHAPLRVPGPEARVEGGIARCGVGPVLLVRAVEVQHAPRR